MPAIKTLMFAGINSVADTARRFGITAIDQDVAQYNAANNANDNVASRFEPSLALGTAEIPLLQMVEHVMGRCDSAFQAKYLGMYPDGITPPCFNFGFNDMTFTAPDGVVEYLTSVVDGLKGSGNYDWMLPNEEPQQTGAAQPVPTAGGSGATPTP